MYQIKKLLAFFLTFAMLFSMTVMFSGALAAEDLGGGAARTQDSVGREEISFNNDWRFYRGNIAGAEEVDFDDSEWLYVNTPHSTLQYTPENYYHVDQGVFWYRRHFATPAGSEGKQLLLTFEGAMQEATVWLNGTRLGVHQGGYTVFAYDLTGKLKTDGSQNVLSVKLDTRPNAAFAPGKTNPDFQYFGGLYRNVYLTVTDSVHITDSIYADTEAGGGVFLTAPAVSAESAAVKARTQVKNDGAVEASVTVLTELIYKGASVVQDETAAQAVAAGATQDFTQNLTVANPKLWSTNTPELYTVRTTVKKDGAVCDMMDTTYGIRKVEWKRDGCYINGEKVELMGTNLHAETYMLGNAQSDDAIFAEIKRLRENGFNFIRMAHYPHSPAYYEACDKYGVAVLDCIAGWQQYYNTTAFNEDCYQQIRDMVRENRNHASIVAWEPSLNESGYTQAWAQAAHNTVKAEYPEERDSKAYTGGHRSLSVFDIIVTTPQANVVNEANNYPSKPIIVGEYGDWNYGTHNSGFNSNTRVTREPEHLVNRNNIPVKGGDEGMLEQCDNLQESLAFNRRQVWGSSSAYWQYADYAGFDTEVLTYCGVVDVARIPKFGAYFFQSQRDPAVDLSAYGMDSGPMAFIANTWASDSPDKVRIFSNCEKVKLYLDNTLIAEQTPDATMWGPHGSLDNNPTGYPNGNGQNISTENLAHPPFTFDLSGVANATPGTGTLRAEGYIGENKVAEYVRRAPGAAAQLALEAENSEPLRLDGSTAKLVWVDVKDANGTVVNTAGHAVSFTTEGPGFVIGEKTVNVRGGQWAVWVRSTRGEGDITLNATADGLTAAQLTITTETVPGLPDVPDGGDADEMGFVQPEPPENIFLDKPASASSINTPGGREEKAEYANDGDESTKWCAKVTNSSDSSMGGHWWQADLGGRYQVETIEIAFDQAAGYQYQVAVSDDPDFTGYSVQDHEIKTETGGRAAEAVNAAGRYVRVYLNCPTSTAWPCLKEVSGTGTSLNVALGKVAKANTSADNTNPGEAIDGDSDTHWVGAYGPSWWQVDLGETYHVDEVSLFFKWANDDRANKPVRHSFKLQCSPDGAQWTDVDTWSDMDDTSDVRTAIATLTADCYTRYLRVSDLNAVTVGGSAQWTEIAEFSVTGDAMGEAKRLDYGAKASATSSAAASDPSYGNSGDPNKYWVPAAGDAAPSWQYDAAGLYTMNKVDLTWNSDGTHKYSIDLSTDGKTWVTAVDRREAGAAGLTTSDVVGGLARYVRVSLEQGTADGFWINSNGWARSPVLEVNTVGTPAAVEAAKGTEFADLELPKEVAVTLAGEIETSLPVAWSGENYDKNSTQAQTLKGSLEAMDGVINSGGHSVSITVTLSEAHSHVMTHVFDKAATCTEDGNIEYWYCAECGKYFSDETGETEIALENTKLAKLGHAYGEWAVVKAATCTEAGQEERVCAHDPSHRETREIEKLAHSFSEKWMSDASGHWHVCTICNTEKTEILTHTPDREAATETKPVKCTECDYVITPATGHIVHTPDRSKWLYDDADHWYGCEGCSDDVQLEKTAHSGGTATCTAKAVCEVCKHPYGELLAHDYSEWDYDDAQHWKVCSVGGEADESSRTPHTWVLNEETSTGTEKHYDCVCGATKSESAEPPVPERYTVTFETGGGSDVAPIQVEEGEKAAKPADPTRGGYDFAGWYTDEALTVAYDFERTVTGDLTLYAKWEEQEEPHYNPPSNTTTKTEKNGDGSTTKTVTNKKTGAVTETTTYPDGTKIVASTPKDGDTTIEVTVPKRIETVIVTIPTATAPKPGEVAVVVKEDGTKEILKTSIATEDGMRVLLSESCKLEIVDNSKTFTDVASDHWAADVVQFAASRELFTGTGANAFSPAAGMTRGMLMTVLARLDGQDTTLGDTWYSAGMEWAKEQGISDGSAPEAEITRESLAVMLYRYAGNPEVDESRRVKDAAPYGEFADVDSVSGWAGDAMLWAVESGIITGSDNKLNPGGTATRAEVAAMLQRFISR